MGNRQNWGSYRPTEERSPNDFIAAIAEQISHSPLSVLDIEDLVQKYGPRANCYPGEPSTTCCDSAFFVSLSSKNYRKGRGHYYFNEILQKLIQHMQGACPGTTNRATVVTDSFEPDEFQKWKLNIDEIRRTATVDFYLISGSGYTLLSI